MDYPVADFGVDHDVIATNDSMKWVEGDTEHEWKLAPDFKWSNLPNEDVEFKLVEL